MAIVIIKQPEAVSAAVGDVVTFSVEATGVSSYQWQCTYNNGKTWINVSWTGNQTATLTTYTLSETSILYLFRCALTDEDGNVVYTSVVGCQGQYYPAIDGSTPIPSFEYSGEYATMSDSVYWYILLKSSGTLKMKYAKKVDAILVGGGGGGMSGGKDAASGNSGSTETARHGGASGYNVQPTDVVLAKGEEYAVVIGAGGTGGSYGSTSGSTGGETSISGTGVDYAAAGGTGGGNGSTSSTAGTAAGGNTNSAGGAGFLLFSNLALWYVAGGGGGGNATSGSTTGGAGGLGGGGDGGYLAVGGSDGEANTGGGGGGGGFNPNHYYGRGGDGGSGLVIIRGTQRDAIPVFLNGAELEEIIFDGVAVESLYFNGEKLY